VLLVERLGQLANLARSNFFSASWRAVALVVQVVILTILFLQLRKTTENVNRLVGDFHSLVGPILRRASADSNWIATAENLHMVNEASHIVYLARGGRGNKMIRVFYGRRRRRFAPIDACGTAS